MSGREKRREQRQHTAVESGVCALLERECRLQWQHTFKDFLLTEATGPPIHTGRTGTGCFLVALPTNSGAAVGVARRGVCVV